MSKAKQCPSTVDEQPAAPARTARDLSGSSGRAYWRSLDDLAETPQFREFVQREFPAFASELTDSSRRSFLKVMGASLALAGAATMPGCRRPDHPIETYNRKPEDVIHGKSLYYATARPLPGGGSEGLLAETSDGRPIKFEGNPLHAFNNGKSSVASQAEILEMYDADRLRAPSRRNGDAQMDATWAEFDAFAAGHFAAYDRNSGRGLAFLVDKRTSPTRDRIRDRILARWPQAMWLPYEPVDNENARVGAASAFGAPMLESRSLENARRIISIDDDFLGGGNLPEQRGYASGRKVQATDRPTNDMSRLYVIESTLTLTGMAADHRLRLKPSEATIAGMSLMGRLLRAAGGDANTRLANAVDAWVKRSTDGAPASFHLAPANWLDAASQDVLAHRGESVVLVGPNQPALVHAVAHAVNEAIGAIGPIVRFQPVDGDAAASSLASVSELAAAIDAGNVTTLVSIGRNPVYDAPADLDFASKFARVATTITLEVGPTETGAASTWNLNGTHFLEDWGDVAASDGSLSVMQPTIAPLFEGRSDLAFLGKIVGAPEHDAFELVQTTWRQGPLASAGDFDKAWRRTLHDGVFAASRRRGATPTVNAVAVEQSLANPMAITEGMEAVFAPCAKVFDGRYANNGWLQELPDPVTKLTWDNPALMSPATIDKLGITGFLGRIGEQRAPFATVTVNGRSQVMPVWPCPGMPDDVVMITLGYGRRVSGSVGAGAGYDTYSLRSSNGMRTANGATVARAAGTTPIACTQDHHSMEGRAILREADVQAWNKAIEDHSLIVRNKDAYDNERVLPFAEQFGLLSHTPVNEDVYDADQIHHYDVRPQWGMTIDLSTCIGCAVCTIACQSENNIPVVGKTEVNKGREMHWIRVDRYYMGDAAGDVEAASQPVTCMHCESAPCETVCPVNATVHGPEGTNDMAYNRCIGTRYCSNNCPYKVRRFNFFDYATKKLDGDYIGKKYLGGIVKNSDAIPPRLREKIGELDKLKNNPDVTVRERGVMEKCTYCIQRVNEARVDRKLQGLDHIPDGFFQTACQQACPTDAIVFGDILDTSSRVHAERNHPRNYAMLGYLNIGPRTTYLLRMRNPNPAIREPNLDPFHGHGGGEHAPEPHDAAPQDEGHVMRLPVLPDNGVRAALALGGNA